MTAPETEPPTVDEPPDQPQTPAPEPEPEAEPETAAAATGSEPPAEGAGPAPDRAGDAPPEPDYESIDQAEAGRQARVLSGLPGAVAIDEARIRGQLAAGSGAIAAGSIHVTTVNARREKHTWSAAFEPESLRRLADLYAPAASDGELDDLLAEQNAVYLGGETGSGRHATAWLAAARRQGFDRVVGITVAPGVRFTTALEDSDVFRPDHGHVVDAGSGIELDLMDLAMLHERAGKARATVIVVGPPLRRGSDLGPYAVPHRRATPAEMLDRQLRFRVAGRGRCVGDCSDCAGRCVGRWVDRCLAEPQLAAHLGPGTAANEVEVLAAAIAERSSADVDLTALLAGLLPDQLRLQAREILEADDAEHRDDGRTPGGTPAYRRAFRTAYAVFDGAPMASVFRAAGRLIEPSAGPDSSTAGSAAPPSVVDAGDIEVDRLLPDGMRAAHQGPVSSGAPRTAALANPQLIHAILDVAWNDFGMGQRLLRWLDALATDGQPVIRDRAAMVAGRLSSYDFDTVFNDLLEQWAHGRNQGLHRAAGLSLFQCAYDPQVHVPLRRRVQRWVNEGSAYSRNSVVWAYAFGLGQLLPYAGLHDLRRVAQDAWQRRSLLIAIGVEQTYARSRTAEIIGELVDWTRSDQERVQRHAAQAFVRLARRSAESSESQWPELLGRLRDGELRTEEVAELWILSLSYPPTASSAWRVLTYWINRAEHHSAVAQPLLDVVSSMTGVEQVTVRLRHHMRHVWREQRPASTVLAEIAAIIKES